MVKKDEPLKKKLGGSFAWIEWLILLMSPITTEM